ncbi:MAG TPA: hypothetical protein VGS19_02355 [Streptosporangiaceae bacterium]|nr:hypothetical protein [Streptosporangiaceae bacterium]
MPAVAARVDRRVELLDHRRPGWYTFDPNANNNTVTFSLTTAWYVRVNVTANTGWPVGQVSDFAVFPP